MIQFDVIYIRAYFYPLKVHILTTANIFVDDTKSICARRSFQRC